jgi:hypothetical protein
MGRFLEHFGAKSVEEFPEQRYGEALSLLEKKLPQETTHA